jgi:hypothetical protein
VFGHGGPVCGVKGGLDLSANNGLRTDDIKV